MIPVAVKAIDCFTPELTLFVLETDDSTRIQARTIVVASGARYRHPRIADIARFEGRAIWYWASQIEALPGAGDEVILVGGEFSRPRRGVLAVPRVESAHDGRGPSLAESMSRYLIDRIPATLEHRAMTETEIVALAGAPGGNLERVRW